MVIPQKVNGYRSWWRAAAGMCALLIMACLLGGCFRSSSATTTIRFEWRGGEGFAGQVSVHKAADNALQGDTQTYPQGKEPALGEEIPGGVIHGEMGAAMNVLLVVRNPTNEPLRFWAAPHLPLPYPAEPGLLIRCLCTGQQYEIPPHGTWTRVIAAGLNTQAGTRGPVVLTHVLVAGDVPVP